jgi:putative RNA 2'-phosphotransferase
VSDTASDHAAVGTDGKAAVVSSDRWSRSISRRLSYVLRHRPDSIGVALDSSGWVDVADLLTALSSHGLQLTRAQLDEVVRTSDKQRFAYDATGSRIRANQGHSVPVDLQLTPLHPPKELYHGTSERFVAAILREGLTPRGRHHVHLSGDVETARRVSARRTAPVVLRVDAAAMAVEGTAFYRSANGVWLVDLVPPRHLRRYSG